MIRHTGSLGEFQLSSLFSAIIRLNWDYSVVEETRVPRENQCLTPSLWELSQMPWPGFE